MNKLYTNKSELILLFRTDCAFLEVDRVSTVFSAEDTTTVFGDLKFKMQRPLLLGFFFRQKENKSEYYNKHA